MPDDPHRVLPTATCAKFVVSGIKYIARVNHFDARRLSRTYLKTEDYRDDRFHYDKCIFSLE